VVLHLLRPSLASSNLIVPKGRYAVVVSVAPVPGNARVIPTAEISRHAWRALVKLFIHQTLPAVATGAMLILSALFMRSVLITIVNDASQASA